MTDITTPMTDLPRSILVTAAQAGNPLSEEGLEIEINRCSETTWQDLAVILRDLDPDDDEALMIDQTTQHILLIHPCPIPVAIHTAIILIRG